MRKRQVPGCRGAGPLAADWLCLEPAGRERLLAGKSDGGDYPRRGESGGASVGKNRRGGGYGHTSRRGD